MARIVCFSDIHGQGGARKLTKWFESTPGDILVFAGDIQGNSFDDGRLFLSWIHSLPYTHKVLTFGNHDGNYQEILKEAEKYKDIIFLNHQGAEIEGIKIFASPYSLPFGSWWFMIPENELEREYEAIPRNTDILVTHTPPAGILDLTFRGEHCGSVSLAKRIKQLPNLRYHLFGHIHEGYGVIQEGDVAHVNCAVLNELYHMTNDPIIIEDY